MSRLSETITRSTIDLLDLHPPHDDVQAAVIAGLSSMPKTLPCKLLYDERGSQLFEQICELPSYYPTRTETAIMHRHLPAMAERIGRRAMVIEFGSGAGDKSDLLLDALDDPAVFVPIEIDRTILMRSAEALNARFDDLTVLPICADYTQPIDLPDCDTAFDRRVIYFPGSTIGNFHPDEAQRFLAKAAGMVGPGDGLVIGVDLRKDADVLRAAYDDPEGVTAAFNLNLLRRINREAGGDFDLSKFAHEARWNADASRIEMHLVSQTDQVVRLNGKSFQFDQGESIHTECSYKYAPDDFAVLAGAAGWRREMIWTDAQERFSVQRFVRSPV